MEYDTIIIGAGMSGLAAGVRLALAGQTVCIVEQHSVIGGLNSYYKSRGRRCDVGLHALTNYSSRSDRRAPLNRLLRQLRINRDDWDLRPQRSSRICFPGAELRFSNDFGLLCDQVRGRFGNEADQLQRLAQSLPDYDRYADPSLQTSARQYVAEFIRDPLLAEMLLCPLLFYGGSDEHDMPVGQFSVLFRSIYLEGLARPSQGIRAILQSLSQQFRRLGGELRTRTRVAEMQIRNGAVRQIRFDNGQEAAARRVISSAGYHETMRLCGPAYAAAGADTNRMSFVEAVVRLNGPTEPFGGGDSIVFYNRHRYFAYRRPEGLIDARSGIVCFPDHFDYDAPTGERLVRLSCLADYAHWAQLSRNEYSRAKKSVFEQLAAAAAEVVGDVRPLAEDVDLFTPLTIERFTGHDGGAIYGGAGKRFDGTTPISNLFVCGNDQGLVGVVGALMSGIAVANRHILAESGAQPCSV